MPCPQKGAAQLVVATGQLAQQASGGASVAPPAAASQTQVQFAYVLAAAFHALLCSLPLRVLYPTHTFHSNVPHEVGGHSCPLDIGILFAWQFEGGMTSTFVPHWDWLMARHVNGQQIYSSS